VTTMTTDRPPLDRLDPAGFFFLGHSESLNHVERVRAAGPTVYTLKESA